MTGDPGGAVEVMKASLIAKQAEQASATWQNFPDAPNQATQIQKPSRARQKPLEGGQTHFSTLPTMTKASFAKLLEKTPVAALPVPGAILTIASNTPPLDAFKAILARNVLSAPVQAPDGQYVGFLELRDFVSFSVFLCDRYDFRTYGDIIENGIKMFNEPLEGITCSCITSNLTPQILLVATQSILLRTPTIS